MSNRTSSGTEDHRARPNDHHSRVTGLHISLLLFVPAFLSVYFNVNSALVWPQNHEYTSFLFRTRIFAEQMQQGNLLPVWSSVDNLGLGSPFPLFYHKLFYFAAGALNAVGLTEKDAVMWALIGFLWFGATGMYLLLRRIGCSKLTAAAGATYFIFANYTITDWLIRGAVAELAALALIPWMLWSFFVSLDQGRVVKRFGLFLALVFLAHSVMAYFAVIILAPAGLLAVIVRRMHLTASGIVRSLPAVAICILVTAPYALVMLSLGSAYDMRRLLEEPLTPTSQFRPLRSYFWDTDWQWGDNWQNYTTQLDLPLIVLFVISLVLLGVLRHSTSRKRLIDGAILLFLFGIGMILQMPWTAGFYETVPGAEFIQFPWRLLGFITPALIAFSMITAETASARVGPWLCVAACLVGIAGSGVVQPRLYDDIPRMAGSYFVLGDNHVYQPVNAQYIVIEELIAAANRQACSLQSLTADIDWRTEQPVRTYRVSCPQADRVALPLYSAPGMTVWREGNGIVGDCLEKTGYTSLCAIDVDAGESRVSVAFPTMGDMIRSAF